MHGEVYTLKNRILWGMVLGLTDHLPSARFQGKIRVWKRRRFHFRLFWHKVNVQHFCLHVLYYRSQMDTLIVNDTFRSRKIQLFSLDNVFITLLLKKEVFQYAALDFFKPDFFNGRLFVVQRWENFHVFSACWVPL